LDRHSGPGMLKYFDPFIEIGFSINF